MAIKKLHNSRPENQNVIPLWPNIELLTSGVHQLVAELDVDGEEGHVEHRARYA